MKNSLRWTRAVTILALSLVVTGSLAAREPSKAGAVASQGATDAGTAGTGTPSLSGLKQRIAVGAFSGDTFGITDLLTTELVNSGRFIVVERTHLEGVNQERDLGTGNQTTAETAAQASRLLGAQWLITGAVTQSADAGPKTINVGLGGISHGLIGRAFDNVDAGLSGSTAKILLDVRILDATSGQVLYSLHAEGKATGHGSSIQIEKNNLNLASDRGPSTPLGEASRKAVQQAVAAILLKTKNASGTGQDAGQVIEVIDGQVYINYGAESGIRAGDTLAVSTVVKQLVDPATGLSLGNAEHQLGELRVQTVNEKFSVAQPVGDFQTKRGDLVRIKPRA
jgi:curli biogenesis system outer membrane secretion channel CsgG